MSTYESGLAIWKKWTEMWNGKPELARDLVATKFALHLPLPGGVDEGTITEPDAVVGFVRTHLAKFERAIYRYGVGPFVDTVAGVVAGPWTGEFFVDGKVTHVSGMDTIRFEDGRITEYWTLAKESEGPGRWNESLSD